MEAARVVSADAKVPEGAEELGSALEMLHTYSLIHDDLPALDNDDLRRGKPTCHKVYGEAIAILAGDALQTYAYEVLSRLKCPAEARVRIIYEVAHATGTVNGMIGGQVMDLEAERTLPGSSTMKLIHESKTGALITAALVTGAIYAGASPDQEKALRTFGKCVGLAFQIIDDVLDVTQSSEQLGKTAGKDKSSQKATYPALFGIEESIVQADSLIGRGEQALALFGERAETLKQLANFLVERKK
jgi:geranylgeranyl diphosphate synthase type II